MCLKLEKLISKVKSLNEFGLKAAFKKAKVLGQSPKGSKSAKEPSTKRHFPPKPMGPKVQGAQSPWCPKPNKSKRPNFTLQKFYFCA